jgi:hypothetical protein
VIAGPEAVPDQVNVFQADRCVLLRADPGKDVTNREKRSRRQSRPAFEVGVVASALEVLIGHLLTVWRGCRGDDMPTPRCGTSIGHARQSPASSELPRDVGGNVGMSR